VLKAPALAAAVAAIAGARVSLDGLLVDYHLDDGNGIEAIAELRRRFGADLTAILVTADASPQVREDARANGIQVLNKPVKPAALRALLTQWRGRAGAAAGEARLPPSAGRPRARRPPPPPPGPRRPRRRPHP